jgi:ketosteroid isomerase-like protein
VFFTLKLIIMETVAMNNTQIAQAVYRYFGEGNVPAILDLLTDDIKWTCPGPNDILPYARIYNGKQDVAEFFRLINENKEFPKFEPREFIAEGDKVVTLGYWDAKSKKTGKPYSGHWAMAFYFRDGKIYEHREYYDSYGEAMASKG